MAYSVITPAVVMRPMLEADPGFSCVNHIVPSLAAVIPATTESVQLGRGYRVVAPAVVMRPIRQGLANHSVPSDPTARGDSGKVAAGYEVMVVPGVVMRPIKPVASVNHSDPSGPVTIAASGSTWRWSGYSDMTPAVVMRPSLSPRINHIAPSRPEVIDPRRTWG